MKPLARLLAACTFLLYATRGVGQEDSTMYVHYINVGQAASVLLEFPCGAILIDAGAQDDAYHKRLIDYLTAFFVRRKDLHSTLALIMITHPHIDHNEALADIAAKFRVERYIDDGLTVGSGRANQKWMQSQVGPAKISYEALTYEDITKAGNLKGKTDSIIDPINCVNGDPKIIAYSGQFEKKPDDWTATDYSNYNNHSLVIKILFGKASFLFTGDLETKGLQKLLATYAPSRALDVDVLMVGHHGAGNATTEDYLKEVTPVYAVISCGQWDYGKGGTNKFTTFYYGHPRISTIQMLEEYITQARPSPVTEEAAEGAQDFRDIQESKCIYATPWDQDIIIKATMAGKYSITTDTNSNNN